MSRSGYSDDIDDQWTWIKWRGQVASAIRGRRGQAFLREMLAALDALPEKKLIRNELESGGQYCAIGAVGRGRGVDMSNLDPENYEGVATIFGIAHQLAQEIVYVNDEEFWRHSSEDRFTAMRAWVANQIRDAP